MARIAGVTTTHTMSAEEEAQWAIDARKIRVPVVRNARPVVARWQLEGLIDELWQARPSLTRDECAALVRRKLHVA